MSEIKILNGAMGTELQRRGYETKLPLWSGSANLDAPELVKQIHEDYVKAGADIIVTNTFRTNPRPWKKVGREDEAAEATKRAIEIAIEVKNENPGVEVAGSLTSLEDCYEPESVPPVDELEAEHSKQVELFKDSGVDYLFLETLNKISEIEVLAKHAHRVGLPFYVSVVTDHDGNLLSHEPLEDMIKAIEQYNPKGFMVNCRPPEVIIHAAKKLAEIWEGEKGIYANGHGEPANDLGWQFYDRCSPEDYIEHAKEWIDLGFTIIGSCCGSNPDFTKRLVEEFKK
jgi:homocysteine S-methyltransferase